MFQGYISFKIFIYLYLAVHVDSSIFIAAGELVVVAYGI